MKITKETLKKSMRIRILLILVFAILIVLMFPKGESIESEVSVGSIWVEDDLIASTTFEVLKDPAVYEKEVSAAISTVYPIFVINAETEQKAIDSAKSYAEFLILTIDNELFNASTQMQNPTFLSNTSYNKFKEIRQNEKLLSQKPDWELKQLKRIVETVLSKVYRRGLLNLNYPVIGSDTISVRDGKFERAYPKTTFFDDQSLKSFIENEVKSSTDNDQELTLAIEEFVYHFSTPNIIYNQKMTDTAVELARESVPRNTGVINENERIVAKHDRITEQVKLAIDSYRKAKGSEIGFWGRFIQNIGKFLHVLIILVPLSIYIFLFRKHIFYDNSKILLILIISLFVCSIAFLTLQININLPVELLVLVPVASMLLTIVFDSRIGFYTTIVISLIVGGLYGNNYVLSVTNILAGGLAAYTVRDVKNRNQIFRSFIFILLGYIVATLAFGFERYESIETILINSSLASINAIISPALTYGLIIFIEKSFKITTELTLFELTDFNSPLLKELARNAPGTFTHSMTIGSLVEAAAEKIGANPILARVGAYYHDIGKALSPEVFVENQVEKQSIHEELEPKESAQRIINHVIRGVEWAKKNKLPQEIIDFIPTHHGTMLVSFFYEKAVKLYGEENVDKDDFRYPGPKPFTKETALLMIADACESISRTLETPDPQKVENIITNIIKQRMDDGQLENVPLTLSDLTQIKKSFLNTLIGQHHKRIRYPNQDKLESEAEVKPE
ncbi:MAG: HDIG domain-containing protein [Melioribacteraceae bacterium]|nr:HDIG domain-containing protein [Melioribacteraceae bacterium]MCO6474092.1 HDIG domain-containing protein [Melioribacteraceae bacterium]